MGYIYGTNMLLIVLNGGSKQSNVEWIFRWCYLYHDGGILSNTAIDVFTTSWTLKTLHSATQCVYVFYVILTVNSECTYVPKHVGPFNGEAVLGTGFLYII
jgi:hypothetical protein